MDKYGPRTQLTSSDDLNAITDNGTYWYLTESVPAHAPYNNAAVVEVHGSTSSVTQKIQRVTRYGVPGQSAFRPLITSSGWLDWAYDITKADFAVVRIDIAVESANARTEITQMSGRGRYWIPVVDGHSSAIVSRPEVTFDGSKWYIFADVAQTYYVSFYKYPVTL